MLTADYPYCFFNFESWNQVQEKCLPYFTKDCNLVIGASVASGKTAMAEAIMGYELHNGNKTIYVSPLKAISGEKIASWKKHPTFCDKNIIIVDSRHHPEEETYDKSQMMVATVESLHILVRKEKPWLNGVGVLIFDEAHLMGDEERGAVSEVLLMDFTQLCPNARIVMLSGTMGNAKEIASWLNKINGKPTQYFNSSWRPTPLIKTVEIADSFKEEVKALVSHVNESPDSKIMVFVHSKKLGELLSKELKKQNIRNAFFHAGLQERIKEAILARYRNPASGLNLLVTTSSLSMGVDL